MARPLVGADVPGVRSLVRPGLSGWLVPVRDGAALGEQLSQLTEQPRQTLAEVGLAARELVEQAFSIQRVNGVYLARLKELLTDE